MLSLCAKFSKIIPVGISGSVWIMSRLGACVMLAVSVGAIAQALITAREVVAVLGSGGVR